MKNNLKNLFLCLIMSLILVSFAACGSNNTPVQTGDPGPADNASDQEAPPSQGDAGETGSDEDLAQMSEEDALEMIQANWGGSVHAATFVLDRNDENSSCAKCHSPINWQPTLDDLPESCFSCKFELSKPDPVVAEQDWLNIPCKVCHEVGKRDKVEPEIKWLEIAQLDEYADVGSSTELCQKCHLGEAFNDHGGIQDLGVHEGMECTTCHDAHSNQATCLDSGCHEGALGNGSPGHIDEHVNVACVACHDASEMALGFREDGLFSTLEVLSTEAGESTFFFASHNLQIESSCERCHYAGNPYGIAETIEP